MPWFLRRTAKHADRERSVVLTGVGDEFDRNACLTQGAVHLLCLPHRIGGVCFALYKQKRRLRVRNTGERALTPGVLHVLPWLAEVPSVVPGTAFGAILTELIDDRRAADDGFEAVGLP